MTRHRPGACGKPARSATSRQKLLDSFGVAVLVRSGADFQARNDHGSHLIDALTEPGA
jgi:hypothetical protein